MELQGYWKFHRCMFNHPVWKRPMATRLVWITILSHANYIPKDWLFKTERITIQPGSLITSIAHLAELAGVSFKQTRTAIKDLIALDSIRANQRANRFTEINVVNWDIYNGTTQDEGKPKGQQRANRGQTEGNDVRRKEGNKERIELPCEAPASRNGHEALNILEWLNRKSHRNYRPSDTNLNFIRDRLKDGIADWQLKAIVSLKCEQWTGTDMEKYLRPATLFNKTKCEQYLGELPREDTNGLPSMRSGTA